MRRTLLLVLVAFLALAAPAVALAALPEVLVQGVEAEGYPNISLTVVLPAELTQGQSGAPEFSVVENGRAADVVRVQSTEIRAEPIDVVLLIDTSGSMRGEALRHAQDAARAFIEEMDGPGRIAVMGFSSKPRLVQGFTDDKALLVRAVGSLDAAGETSMYDALRKAVSMADSSAGPAHIVLLSDGGDTVSASGLEQVVADVKASKTPVHAVALQTGEANVEALRVIAEQSGGRMTPVAEAAELAGFYRGIARELQSRYVVTFRTDKPTTKDLEVDVTAELDGRKAIGRTAFPNPLFEYMEPETGTGLTAVQPGNPLFLMLTVLLAFGSVAMLVAGVLLALYRPRTALEQVRYYEQLRSTSDELSGIDDADTTSVRSRVVDAVGYVAGKGGFTELVHKQLERAGLPLRPAEYIAAHLLIVVAVGALTQLATGRLVLSVAMVLVAAFVPVFIIDMLVSRRKHQFESQLPDMLSLVAGSLRSGWGLQQAVDLIVQETFPPVSTEFKRVQTESRLGMPVEESLHAMAERLDSEDFRWVVTAIAIQREVGGNLAEVLDIVASTIRDRDALRRHVRALTAEGRLSAFILILLPFFEFFVLMLINPDYMSQMLSSFAGVFMLAFGLILMLVGAIWLRLATKVEV